MDELELTMDQLTKLQVLSTNLIIILAGKRMGNIGEKTSDALKKFGVSKEFYNTVVSAGLKEIESPEFLSLNNISISDIERISKE